MASLTRSSSTKYWPIDKLRDFEIEHFVEVDIRPAPLTVGAASRNVSPATIRRLWEKGRNLTRDEIRLKVDLILSETVPATGPR